MHEEYIYKQMYLHLFNAVTDALELLETDTHLAELRLKAAQQRTEEMYITYCDP